MHYILVHEKVSTQKMLIMVVIRLNYQYIKDIFGEEPWWVLRKYALSSRIPHSNNHSIDQIMRVPSQNFNLSSTLRSTFKGQGPM